MALSTEQPVRPSAKAIALISLYARFLSSTKGNLQQILDRSPNKTGLVEIGSEMAILVYSGKPSLSLLQAVADGAGRLFSRNSWNEAKPVAATMRCTCEPVILDD